MEKVKFKDGSIFDGEFINPLKIKGKLTYTNGNFAEGEFQIINNLPQIIKGKLTFKNGNFDEGEFKDGKFIKGISNIKNKGVFEGELRNGLFFKGKMIYEDGDIFEGYFKDGIAKNGKLTLSKIGTIFEGELEDGFPMPLNGKETTIDGTVFEGEFKSGNYFKGTLSKSNMFFFEGELKDMVPYKGKTTFFTDNILNGTFEGESKDGFPYKGKFKSSKGWSFEGEYIQLPSEEHPIDNYTGINIGLEGGFLPTIKKGKLTLNGSSGLLEGYFKLKNVNPPELIPKQKKGTPFNIGFENIEESILDENGNINNQTLEELKIIYERHNNGIVQGEFFYGEVKLISRDISSTNYSLVLDEKVRISVKNDTHIKLTEYQFNFPTTFFIIAPILSVEEINGTIPDSCIQIKSSSDYFELRLKYVGY